MHQFSTLTEPRHSPLLLRLREFPRLTMVERHGVARPKRRSRSGDSGRGRQQDSRKSEPHGPDDARQAAALALAEPRFRVGSIGASVATRILGHCSIVSICSLKTAILCIEFNAPTRRDRWTRLFSFQHFSQTNRPIIEIPWPLDMPVRSGSA
jgi:hypothetical protein